MKIQKWSWELAPHSFRFSLGITLKADSSSREERLSGGIFEYLWNLYSQKILNRPDDPFLPFHGSPYHGNTAKNRYISTRDLGLNRFQNFKVDSISPFQYLAFGCGPMLRDPILVLEIWYHGSSRSRLGALYRSEANFSPH